MAEDNPYSAPNYSDPNSVDGEGNQVGPAGLGGWLILIAIGLVLSPLRLVAMTLQVFVPIFTDGTWEILTTPGSDQYHALWAPILIFEVIANIGFFIAYIVLAVLFFRKSRLFPKLFITLAAVNLCFVVIDAWLGSLVLAGEPIFDPDTARELIRLVIYSAIWVPYMLISKRVKNTFVE